MYLLKINRSEPVVIGNAVKLMLTVNIDQYVTPWRGHGYHTFKRHLPVMPGERRLWLLKNKRTGEIDKFEIVKVKKI